MDSAGPTSQTEATAITAPTPTKMARILVSASFHCNAQAMIAIAADASTAPVHVRALRLLLGVWSPERMASTGGTAPARAAGVQAAIMVITTPTMRGTITATGSNVRPSPGMEILMASRSMNSPWLSPNPVITPSAEPMRPTMNASKRTDAVSCRREAPRARRRANSFMR